MDTSVNYEDKRLTLDEEWRDVAGYEGYYQVSNLGRVKNTRTSHLLKPLKSTNGYYRVGLTVNDKTKFFRIHRLVAQSFLPNPDNLLFINHKDENKLNNVVENLEWCTALYNLTYGTRLCRIADKLKGRKAPRSIEAIMKQCKPILQLSLNGQFVKRWESAKRCQDETGFGASTIHKCCYGQYKQAYGYLWRFENGKINAR